MSDRIMTEQIPLFPNYYFPSISVLADFAQQKEIHILRNQPFEKNTYLNRMYVASANNTLCLSIPILGGRHNHLPLNEVVYADNVWKSQHFKTVQSAYGGSRYYTYYKDELEDIIKGDYIYLSDICEASNRFLSKYLLDKKTITFHNEIKSHFRLELYKHNPSNRLRKTYPPYFQVFEHKLGFASNLSGLDLLFNLGPEARGYLESLVN